MNLQIRSLQHIGIPVTELPVSELFYRKLGFTNVMGTGFVYNGGQGRVAMMQQGQIMLELYQLPEQELAAIRNRKNGHIDHIAFDVADIDQTFTEIKNAGFEVLEPAPVFLAFWKNGCKYFNITGPDGERLEFNQVL